MEVMVVGVAEGLFDLHPLILGCIVIFVIIMVSAGLIGLEAGRSPRDGSSAGRESSGMATLRPPGEGRDDW